MVGWCSMGTFNDPCVISCWLREKFGVGWGASEKPLYISSSFGGRTHRFKGNYRYIWWVCLKMGYTPNEIAIFHRDNDQQNHWVQWGTLFSDTPIYYKNDQYISIELDLSLDVFPLSREISLPWPGAHGHCLCLDGRPWSLVSEGPLASP